jgi:murein DD-endopeptidase MepM/ murein hydrolase activator NlpD
MRSSSGVVTQSEGIWTATWTEYGASYVLAVECSDPAVPTCSQNGVISVANDLRYVGGGKNAPTGRSTPQDISPNTPKHKDAQFQYNPPGRLAPGSGQGLPDFKIYAPGVRFPIAQKPAFANSQVWNPGGMHGPPNGSQCDSQNYAYPWWDNFCETRTFDTPMCPASTGHQGQDIRAPSCKADYYPVVSVDEGVVTNIGSYSVFITDSAGTQFRYLHMSSLKITQGQRVTRGQQLGNVSNIFGSSATTIHLHFEIVQNIDSYGFTHVSPYMSLVRAYEQLPQ